MNDQSIEKEILAKGLTAPRITPADIEANIASEHYFTAMDGVIGQQMTVLPSYQPLELLTFCVLVLSNGYTVHGVSACASPENFNAEIGRKIARQNAVQMIWPLMGYALKNQLNVSQETAESKKLRAALAGLIGVDGKSELEQLEATLRFLPAPDADKAVSINAIHALLATLPE